MDESSNEDLQAQIDAVIRHMEANRRNIDALTTRADTSDLRADASEAQALIDRDMIAELQRDGVISQQHADQMDEALKSSRTIGAAIGLIMGSRDMTEEQAFAVLRSASQNSNRKLRELAAELVATSSGAVRGLQGAAKR